MRTRLPALLRDLLFLALSLVVFYDQLFIAKEAQPLLVFLGIFFLGCVPALQGDKKTGYSMIARFAIRLMGVELPDQNPSGTDSSDDTPTQSESSVSHSRSQSSPKS